MSQKPNTKIPPAILLLLAFSFTALFFTLNVLRYQGLFSLEWGDEAVHNQLAWRTFRDGLFSSTLKGDQIFDQHFRPIWLLVALFYLPFPSIYAWYFLQSVFFAGASIVLYYWAIGRRQDPWGALLISGSFLFYPPLHQLAIGVYDPEKLALLFLPCALLAFQKRRFWLFAAFIVLALCCKEIVGFTVFMFAIMLLIAKKPARYWAFAGSISIVWVLFSFLWIIPSTMSAQYGVKYFPQLLGSDCESAACLFKYALSNPLSVIAKIFSPEHLRILGLLIAPVCGLILLAPLLLLPTLAGIGMILSVPGPLLINQHHWFVASVPFLFAGAIAGSQKLAQWFGKDDTAKGDRVYRMAGIAIFISCLLFSIFGGFVGRFHDDQIDDPGYSDLKSVFDGRIYHQSERDETAWKLIRQVPGDAVVTANYDLMPPLSARKIIREFGRNAPGYDYFDFDYILIALEDKYFGAGHDVRIHPDDCRRLIDEVRSGKIHALFSNKDLFLGRQSKSGDSINPATVEKAVENIERAAKLADEKLNQLGFSDIRD